MVSNGGSYAGYALRYAASFSKIAVVLSGMENLTMIKDNTSFIKNFEPLSEIEAEAVREVQDILKHQDSYKMYGLQVLILIPDLFASKTGTAILLQSSLHKK